jgi:formylglycine-generating enzyme required for sulfatase activity
MGKLEVSNEQYRRYKTSHDSKGYKGHNLNGDHQPAVNVSWNDARAYAMWLTEKGGGRFRLPTEAEWEYAARAGTETTRYWGDDSDKACRYANVADQSAKWEWSSWSIHDCDDGYKVTAPVGSYQANGFALHDMLGNVWEWVNDWYNENAYLKAYKKNPQGSISGVRRVLRGGSWGNRPAGVRADYRGRNTPGFRGNGLGFRLARTDP